MKKLPSLKQIAGWTRCSIFGGSDHGTMLSQNDSYFRKRSSQSKTALIIQLTSDEKDNYHERKCIMEYDGGLTRENAEWQALDLIYNKRKKQKIIVMG